MKHHTPHRRCRALDPRSGVQWEDHFSALANQIGMPGGTPWEGDAADAAYQRAHADRLIVIGQADQLHDAARIARAGADDISWADGVLKLVETAQNAGFVVGEDFSVSKPGLYHPAAAAIMQSQAQAIAAELRTKVGTLVATDAEVAADLTAATATVGTTVFPEPESAPTTVQLVDHKTAPPPQPTPTPTPPIPPEIQKRLDEQQKQIDELTEKAKGSPVSDAASSFMSGCVAGAAGAGIAGTVTGPVDGPIIIGGCIVGGTTNALGKLAEEWTTNVLDAG